MPIRPLCPVLAAALALASQPLSGAPALAAPVQARLDADYPSLEALYRDLHSHPELSLMEVRTSARVAAELRAAGFDVTEKFGGTGIVGVLRNGPGPALLIRTDMDALPVKEETGLAYASSEHALNLSGKDVPVMHACGHDVHMTIFVGTARMLAGMRDRWSGTLVLVGQPAEEMVVGARNMLAAGLYRQFPRPDFAIGLHDDPQLATGSVAFCEGFFSSNSDSVDITVRGIGGHGARPDNAKDPVVLAAQIVLALQTIVSREIHPGERAVVTVGTIHGGTRSNIIPDEVKLQLTLRSYSGDVRAHLVAAIRRICRGEAIAAGIPEELMPVVTVIEGESAQAIYNDPALTRRVRAAVTAWLGPDRVGSLEPEMFSEDFSQYGRTVEKVPICFYIVGASAPERIAESVRTGVPLPALHSSRFAPVPEPTIKTGVTAMTAAALDLLPKN
ncbi:MAG: amidohydrolase [Opitutaceae bacterium]|jgi:hippurate hydrolase